MSEVRDSSAYINRKQWNDACLAMGIPSLTKDTSAKIMAVMYVCAGEREAFTFCPKLVADIEYIQQRFHIKGGETPDAEFVETLKPYVRELEADEKTYPQWAVDLFDAQYGLRL